MPFFMDVIKELETLMPSYSITWTGVDYTMHKNVLMADEKTPIMVVMRETGVFVYKWRDEEVYATRAVYENFPLDKDIFETETSWRPVYLLQRDEDTGLIKYDLDFLQASRIVDADTFNDLMVDFEKYLKCLNIPITGYISN
jgi:hypothetical protein